MINRLLLLTPLLIFIFSIQCDKPEDTPQADLVITNAKIITMDEANPAGEAMAIHQGKIVAVGTTSTILKKYSAQKVLDLKGKHVFPGIIESHGHLLSLGESFLKLNLMGIKNPQEAIAKVAERVKETPAGEWIIGWGWDEGAWAKNYPDNKVLSQVSPDNPVCLTGLHGFASWVNDRALEEAGISVKIPDPPNGEILRDSKTKKATGILTNKAQDLILKKIPPLTLKQCEKALALALNECLAHGLTSVHEAKTTRLMLKAMRSLLVQEKLNCRLYVMLDGSDEGLVEPFFKKGPEIDPSHMLTIRCIKIFVDGALGSRGAAFFEPYSDASTMNGVVVTPEETLYEISCKSLKAGFQVASHAIGDRANRITLDAFKRAIEEVPEVKDHRLRLEHAQVVRVKDIDKFAPLGIVLSMQPPHCTSDMPWAEERVGPERIKGAYAWRSFMKTGVHLTLNSDFPGETLNPFYGMYAAETRQTPEGKPDGGWYPEQCLTREEVLKAYTIEAAYSGFEESIKGKIASGMLADFIILSGDIQKISSKELLSLQVEQTFLGGKLVYKK
jgi:predicted amidohydrolase YtcJ